MDIWDLAASPQGRSIAAATTTGVTVFTNVNERSLDAITTFSLPETMIVSYKDENVVFAGQRSGTVGLCDLRAHQFIQNRIRHGSGVTALRALSDHNYVLVRGSQHGKMSIYDLRFTPPVKATETSKRYVDFQAKDLPDRHGLGFDYDSNVDIVATAYSGSLQNRVSLFSTKTGKTIVSPLNRHSFQSPVTCLRFANFRSGMTDGKIDPSIGPKGIFTASGSLIDVWSAEGCGIETEEQE